MPDTMLCICLRHSAFNRIHCYTYINSAAAVTDYMHFFFINRFCSYLYILFFIMAFFLMMYNFIPCLLIYDGFIMAFFRRNKLAVFIMPLFFMLYFFYPCFFINHGFPVPFLWRYQNLLVPCFLIHYPDKTVTNPCFIYRNKRGKVRIISRNNADTA